MRKTCSAWRQFAKKRGKINQTLSIVNYSHNFIESLKLVQDKNLTFIIPFPEAQEYMTASNNQTLLKKIKFKPNHLGLSESLITLMNEPCQLCSHIQLITENEIGATQIQATTKHTPSLSLAHTHTHMELSHRLLLSENKILSLLPG